MYDPNVIRIMQWQWWPSIHLQNNKLVGYKQSWISDISLNGRSTLGIICTPAMGKHIHIYNCTTSIHKAGLQFFFLLAGMDNLETTNYKCE